MISVQNLSKSYEGKVAVQDVSFTIKQGECYGLLGPNGAGKTTTISMLSTILKPDSGTVTIAGYDLATQANECKKSIGVVPQEIALYNELTAYDNLLFWGSLYNVPSGDLKKRADDILKLFGLYDRRNDRVKTYSGGMKRRINIAAALLHHPHILFMDEPTVGIDPQSRNLIFEVVEKLHKDGMSIIYTTHYMEEAERLCDRIAIIEGGKIIAQGTLDELKSTSAIKETIVVTFSGLTEEHFKTLSAQFPEIRRADNKILLPSANAKTDLSRIIVKCTDLGVDILQIDIQKVNLETIFLNLTGKQLRD